MKVVSLTISQPEKELLSVIGVVSVLETTLDQKLKVHFSFARWLNMQELMEILESAIARQELDGGDWLRAKEWREAKPELQNKLRKAYLEIFRD